MKDIKKCIEACQACAIACQECAAACVKEGHSGCTLICLDCADICELCVKLAARGSQYHVDLCALCVKVCKECATECDEHGATHAHCKECAKAFKKCIEACS